LQKSRAPPLFLTHWISLLQGIEQRVTLETVALPRPHTFFTDQAFLFFYVPPFFTSFVLLARNRQLKKRAPPPVDCAASLLIFFGFFKPSSSCTTISLFSALSLHRATRAPGPYIVPRCVPFLSLSGIPLFFFFNGRWVHLPSNPGMFNDFLAHSLVYFGFVPLCAFLLLPSLFLLFQCRFPSLPFVPRCRVVSAECWVFFIFLMQLRMDFFFMAPSLFISVKSTSLSTSSPKLIARLG